MLADSQSLIVGVPLAVILLCSCITDLRTQRIRNPLTYGGATMGVAIHGILGGLPGIGFALSGLAVGLALMLIPYLGGGLGAGDVKLMAAAGSFLGPLNTFWAVLFTFLIGAVLALSVMAVRGQATASLRRLARSLWIFLGSRVWSSAEKDPTDPGRQRFPYAVAIAGGVAVSWFGSR